MEDIPFIAKLFFLLAFEFTFIKWGIIDNFRRKPEGKTPKSMAGKIFLSLFFAILAVIVAAFFIIYMG